MLDPLGASLSPLGLDATYAGLAQSRQHAAAVSALSAAGLGAGLPTSLHQGLLGRPFALPGAEFGTFHAAAESGVANGRSAVASSSGPLAIDRRPAPDGS